ncbi:sensor histidine kinase [Ideonella sp. A 288]|uniref:sensor histidine kinase n=1 Tax=Ideonella sp. A 288 TaxID=1962181 RepID=UPI000B4A6D3A|nr:ATP-binding protein [Ideonella sp. A 288]
MQFFKRRRTANAWQATPGGGFRLMRLFSIAGAVAIGAFSLVMALLLSRFIEARMLERDAALSRDFVQSVSNTQRVAQSMRTRGNLDSSNFVEFCTHLSAMPDVQRVNVYSTDRRVLWSSRPEIIGQQFGANEELDEALQGRLVIHTEAGPEKQDKAEHVLLPSRDKRYVENYVPVYDEARNELVGVVELYREPAALFDAIRSGRRLVWTGSALGGLCLFATLIWFVRRAEQQLREQRTQLIEADALAMVGEISAAVAHSIRNPLGSIRSTAELQHEILGDSDTAYADIVRNVDRVEHLVRTLLTWVRDPAERLGSADLNTALADAAARFGPELQAQSKPFRVELGQSLGAVAADPVLLAQVLNSLLANAVEATRSGDTVTLKAERLGARVHVTVGDTGVGIEPERLGEAFKPFQTGKPRGLGLGLALVRRFVQRIGGEVELTSEPGRGTQVQLRLPIHGG